MRGNWASGATVSGLLWALACSTPLEEPEFDVFEQSISQLQEAMTSGVVTSRRITEQYLAQIDAYDLHGPSLNSIIAVNESAFDQAEALDRERAENGPRGLLHGIPVVVKDNFDVAGMPTTGGSIALADWHPPDDAFQVAKLKEAGAVIIAKTSMHELAFGAETISSLGGQTRNPYDPSRNPGGSSGGTGAAVAANFAAAGMGSDTCGSIRIPLSPSRSSRVARHPRFVEPRRYHSPRAYPRHGRAAGKKRRGSRDPARRNGGVRSRRLIPTSFKRLRSKAPASARLRSHSIPSGLHPKIRRCVA